MQYREPLLVQLALIIISFIISEILVDIFLNFIRRTNLFSKRLKDVLIGVEILIHGLFYAITAILIACLYFSLKYIFGG